MFSNYRIGEFFYRALCSNPARLENSETARDIADEFQSLLDKKYGTPSIIQNSLYDVLNFLHDGGLKALGGFVKKQHGGLLNQSPSYCQLLLLTSGQHTPLSTRNFF
jgi:hypothetical protein